MRIMDVDADFIREMRAATHRDLTVKQLVALSIHGIDAGVFAEFVDLGLFDEEEAAGGEKETA